MGHEIGVLCLGHSGSVVELAFNTDYDNGYFLASAGLDGVATLRHGDTGNWITNLTKHTDSVWSVSLSHDAKILASGGADCKVRVWDALLGKQLKKLTHTKTVACVDLNPKATRLLTGCIDEESSLALFDMEQSDKAPLMEFHGHHRGVRDVTFCLEERCILSASYDRTVRMWDCLSGKRTNSIFLPHHVKSMELHHSGDIVTIAYAGGVIFLDPKSFEVLKHRKLPFKVTAASLSPNKEIYVCGNNKGYSHKYDYATDVNTQVYVSEQPSAVLALRFSPDGEVCAIGSADGSIILWRMSRKSASVVGDQDDDDDGEENESIS
ncbi:serine-threonine kinase receptor-associated protein [Drosophila teissieri]|uniref:serine-threonine kinase receptor-associated protein n=1 Tax=Drosophila teissieri TaxID=7243 RepID=UPI001CBA1F69|nr:serine-threonine kinase receptor-associated protein [Drosophila teissieri]